MIISASRRTDIPAYYMEWFMERLRDGEAWVRNPVNPRQISRIRLGADTVDGIVFWSKNPVGLAAYLEELQPWPWYLQFTLTGYEGDIEPGLPDKNRELIPLFCRLADKAGADRMVWRYDPIFFSEKYTASYHEKTFRNIAEHLRGSTDQAVISFLDLYRKTKRNMKGTGLKEITPEEMKSLAGILAEIAAENGMKTVSCAEPLWAGWPGVEKGACIDRERLEKIGGFRLKAGKDKGQRMECGCMESIDIGAYDTCPAGCRYCYASEGKEGVSLKRLSYRADSPLLCGEAHSGDRIYDRKVSSLRMERFSGEFTQM